MNFNLLALASVFVVSLISLLGVFSLYFSKKALERISFLLVSFSVGSLFGGAFFHLLPEAFEHFKESFLVSFLVLFGIFAFFILEKALRWRHCHIQISKDHPHPLALMNLVGDAVHNLIDGMIIGASFMANTSLGIATTIAVIFHEIPQEMGDFGVLIHAGVKPKKAIFFNFLSSLFAFLGVLISFLAGPNIKDYAFYLLPIAAGGFIYIAGSDLIPELHKKERLKASLFQILLMILGTLVMALLAL